LAKYIPELLKEKLVEKVDRTYRLTERVGYDEFQKNLLLRTIEDSSLCVSGGEGSGSVNPADDVRLKSTVGYAFPGVWFSFLSSIQDLVHENFMAYWLYMQADQFKIDPRYLTGELPEDELLSILREKLPKGIQVLAFSLNFDKIRELINEEYISDILRFLRSNYMVEIDKLALEIKALTFLKNRRSPCELPKIAEHLNTDLEQAEYILDRLVIDYSSPPRERLIKDRKGQKIKIRLEKAKSYLKKTIIGNHIYYHIINPDSQKKFY